MPVTECAEILGLGDYRRALRVGRALGQGNFSRGLGAGNQEEQGKGPSCSEADLLAEDCVLSNWEGAAAGRGAAQLASSKLLFVEVRG